MTSIRAMGILAVSTRKSSISDMSSVVFLGNFFIFFLCFLLDDPVVLGLCCTVAVSCCRFVEGADVVGCCRVGVDSPVLESLQR